MLLAALLFAAAPASSALLDAADEANLRFTQCLFAEARAARAIGLTADAFSRRLATQCLGEETVLRTRGAAVLAQRGTSRDSLDGAIVEARRAVVDSYRLTPP